MTTKEMIETLRYKADNIKAKIEPEFFNEVADRLEILEELQNRKFTIEDLQEYMKFEDELVKKNFTFKSVIEAREKQIGKKPIKVDSGVYDYDFDYECPCCGNNIDEYEHHCECGQKLEWSEVE